MISVRFAQVQEFCTGLSIIQVYLSFGEERRVFTGSRSFVQVQECL